MTTVDASVIVPTHNRGDALRACVAALRAQKTAAAFEIIVVDDGSTDDTAQVAASLEGVTLIRQAQAGPGAARNAGVAAARGPIVLFTDDDCEPEPDWLDRMLAPFADPAVAGAKGTYLTRQTSLTARFVQVEYEEKYDHLTRFDAIDFIDTYSAAFRRDVFLAAGGYDTSFTTASVEDQEFSFRLANAGHRLVFVPEARVWHRHVDSPWGYLRKKYKIGYWKVLALRKNPNKVTGDSHTPLTLKLQVALVPFIAAAALLASAFSTLWPLPLAGAALFLVSSLPLTLRSLRQTVAVGVLAPSFVALRALGLSAGLGWGLLSCPRPPQSAAPGTRRASSSS